MTTREQLEQQILTHIARVAGRDLAAIDRGQHLMADLGIDSPKALELLMDLEESLAIEIPDDDAARFDRVGDLADYVIARAAAG